jgi:23S rRNA pseudoU1915 N3-methylase RlmH
MTNIITEIMVEVLRIFGIATKELKRGSASEFPITCARTFAKSRAERFLRKLARMVDLEDAPKKLDRLTQEEARMAHAEVLRITHSIRNEVKIVDGKVERVEDKVEEVGDKVGDKVQCVDKKVQVVIDGTQGLSSPLKSILTPILSDGKQARVAAKDLGDKVADVGVKVKGVEDKVEDIGDQVQVVIDGAQDPSSLSVAKTFSHLYFQTESKQESRRRKQN